MNATPLEPGSDPVRPLAPWRVHPIVVSGLLLILAGNILLPTALAALPLALKLDNGGVLILGFWVAWLAWRRAQRDGQSAFLFLGLGAALGGLHYLPTMLHLANARILGFIISILGLLSLAVGFLRWPQRARMPRDHIRTILDGIAIGLSFFIAAWMALEPTLAQGRQVTIGMMRVYAIQISICIGVLTLWVLQESRLRLIGQAREKQLVRAALLTLLAHGSLVALLRITGHYYPGYYGHGAEVLCQLANVLLALAVLTPSSTQADATPARKATHFRALLPSAASVVVLVLVFIQAFKPHAQTPWTLMALSLGLLGVLMLRHGLLILDLERLSLGLEARVQERTRRLETLHQSAMTDLRLRMMAGLASGLAHDLNNVLGVIRIRLDLLQESSLTGQRRHLEVLGEALDRALAMVQRILSASRLREVTPVRLALAHWLPTRIELLKAMLAPTQTLVLRTATDLWVNADPQSLEQILENLVANARDAMGPAGTIQIDATPQAGEVRLAVSNDGPEIPPAVLPHLFEPLFTTKPAGTGLGLATVRTLVFQNHGTIRVEHQAGLGPSFIIDLPAASWPE